MGRAVRRFQVTQEGYRHEVFRRDAELLLCFADGCIFRGLPRLDMPTRSTNRAALQASAAEKPAILHNKNADTIVSVGGIGIGGRRSGRRCYGSALFLAARSLPLLNVLLGGFHVAHGARLSTQQRLQQIILVILGDDVFDIKLLIGRKAAAHLGGVERLHIDVCLRSLGLDQSGLSLGLVNCGLLCVAQAPQGLELQFVVGFLGHIA